MEFAPGSTRSYDDWKLDPSTSGYGGDPAYDDYDDPCEICDHEEYEVDWNGYASCGQCGAHWWLSADEHSRHIKFQENAERRWAAMERRERLLGLWRAVTWHLWRRWLPKPEVQYDDEIPF